ncbi:hypothetical protein F5Y02DRAFT_378942 [Annulohypoxylon stygium]|nr:hypothetical protein F5Y02DRAFT_378942 [Annulohypoxylon stygium]
MIPSLQHKINNAKHAVLGRSPNELVLVFRPRSVLSSLDVPISSPDVETLRRCYQKEAQASIDFASVDAKTQRQKKRLYYCARSSKLLCARRRGIHTGILLPSWADPSFVAILRDLIEGLTHSASWISDSKLFEDFCEIYVGDIAMFSDLQSSAGSITRCHPKYSQTSVSISPRRKE